MYPDYRNRFIFISYKGVERSKVIFIGYTNSLLYAQCFIDRTLKLYRKYCCAFIDDMVIFLDIFKDYNKYLETVFSLFEKKSININLEKSFINYLSVELFGFYVDALDIYFTEDCIQGFRQLEFLATLKALETYLGATGFLCSLIPYYVQIADPLQQRKTTIFVEGRQ